MKKLDETTTLDGVGSTGVLGTFNAPNRVESSDPKGYRLGRKPNGRLVLQGAYMWSEGLCGGYEWRDIPTVDLDA